MAAPWGWCDNITKADIDLNLDPRSFKRSHKVNTNTLVIRILSNALGGYSIWIEAKSIRFGFAPQADREIAPFKEAPAIEMTFRALQEIPWSLLGIHGRKALIQAMVGLSYQLDSPDSVPGGWHSLLYERAAAALDDARVAVWRCSSLKLVLSSMAVGAQGDEVFCRVVS